MSAFVLASAPPQVTALDDGAFFLVALLVIWATWHWASVRWHHAMLFTVSGMILGYLGPGKWVLEGLVAVTKMLSHVGK